MSCWWAAIRMALAYTNSPTPAQPTSFSPAFSERRSTAVLMDPGRRAITSPLPGEWYQLGVPRQSIMLDRSVEHAGDDAEDPWADRSVLDPPRHHRQLRSRIPHHRRRAHRGLHSRSRSDELASREPQLAQQRHHDPQAEPVRPLVRDAPSGALSRRIDQPDATGTEGFRGIGAQIPCSALFPST